MDIRIIFSVEVRRENSEKALVRIDKLNEAEANKVFDQITFPTVKQPGEFYKAILREGNAGEDPWIMRKKEM